MPPLLLSLWAQKNMSCRALNGIRATNLSLLLPHTYSRNVSSPRCFFHSLPRPVEWMLCDSSNRGSCFDVVHLLNQPNEWKLLYYAQYLDTSPLSIWFVVEPWAPPHLSSKLKRFPFSSSFFVFSIFHFALRATDNNGWRYTKYTMKNNWKWK